MGQERLKRSVAHTLQGVPLAPAARVCYDNDDLAAAPGWCGRSFLEGCVLDKAHIEQLKRQRAFLPWDVLVYGLLALLIGALFWAFVFARHTQPLAALEVYRDSRAGEQLVLRYDYAADAFEVSEAWAGQVQLQPVEGGWAATIATEGGGYNVLQVREGKAYISDANCSNRGDCMEFSPITGGDEVIICVPHHLTVLGVGETNTPEPQDPIIG